MTPAQRVFSDMAAVLASWPASATTPHSIQTPKVGTQVNR